MNQKIYSSICNSKGEYPILTLNSMEQRVADSLQRRLKLDNALGAEINITTLTTVIKKVTEQKFFEQSPADYMPIKVGDGAWSTNLQTFRSFVLGDGFDTGVLNTGLNQSKMASADAGVDSINVKVINWAKALTWTLFDLQFAAKTGNWDLVTAKETSRLKNWQLGIQRTAFLGLDGDASCLGLMTQAGITTDTTTIPTQISAMTTANFKIFCAAILNVYRVNCNRTAWPTHLIIPESDYLGLAAPTSADFPLKSALQVLEETFSIMVKKPFKILPNAYGDTAFNNLGTNKYMLLNYDEESLRMDIPVDYTSTLANSLDNFSFQNAAYGQFTGVQAYRPLELMYFTHA